MAVSQNELQITWSAANSVSVSSGSNQTSDAITFTSNAIRATIQVKADNDGTPASGDTVDFWLLGSLGDPDGASSDEYGTTEQGQFLIRLDTTLTDPALSSAIEVDFPLKGAKLYAKNNSSGRAITVSGTVRELLA